MPIEKASASGLVDAERQVVRARNPRHISQQGPVGPGHLDRVPTKFCVLPGSNDVRSLPVHRFIDEQRCEIKMADGAIVPFRLLPNGHGQELFGAMSEWREASSGDSHALLRGTISNDGAVFTATASALAVQTLIDATCSPGGGIEAGAGRLLGGSPTTPNASARRGYRGRPYAGTDPLRTLGVPYAMSLESFEFYLKAVLDQRALKDLNDTDRHGETLLHRTVRAKRVDLARSLLARGADPDGSNALLFEGGVSPLYVAAANADGDMMELLLEQGATRLSDNEQDLQTLRTNCGPAILEVIEPVLFADEARLRNQLVRLPRNDSAENSPEGSVLSQVSTFSSLTTRSGVPSQNASHGSPTGDQHAISPDRSNEEAKHEHAALKQRIAAFQKGALSLWRSYPENAEAAKAIDRHLDALLAAQTLPAPFTLDWQYEHMYVVPKGLFEVLMPLERIDLRGRQQEAGFVFELIRSMRSDNEPQLDLDAQTLDWRGKPVDDALCARIATVLRDTKCEVLLDSSGFTDPGLTLLSLRQRHKLPGLYVDGQEILPIPKPITDVTLDDTLGIALAASTASKQSTDTASVLSMQAGLSRWFSSAPASDPMLQRWLGVHEDGGSRRPSKSEQDAAKAFQRCLEGHSNELKLSGLKLNHWPQDCLPRMKHVVKINLSGSNLRNPQGIEHLPALTDINLTGCPIDQASIVEDLMQRGRRCVIRVSEESLSPTVLALVLQTVKRDDGPTFHLHGSQGITKLMPKATVKEWIATHWGAKSAPPGLQEAAQRIQKAVDDGAQALSLAGLGLDHLPPGIFGLFPDLKSLNLSGNKLKEIESLKDLQKLETLDLNGNALKQVDGLSHLELLRELSLDNMKLSGQLDLDGLTELTQVYAQGNALTGVHGLSRLKKLRYLDLTRSITQLPTGVARLDPECTVYVDERFQEELSLRQGFAKAVPQWAEQVLNKHPEFSETTLRLAVDRIQAHIKSDQAPFRLELSGLHLPFLPPDLFVVLDDLHMLDLSGNNLEHVHGLERLKDLRALTWNDNNRPLAPATINGISQLKQLRKLSLTNTQLPKAPLDLTKFNHLYELSLAGAGLTSDSMRPDVQAALKGVRRARVPHRPEGQSRPAWRVRVRPPRHEH